jgi:glutathione S-transferase
VAPSGNKCPPLIPSGRRFFFCQGGAAAKHPRVGGLVKLIGSLDATEDAKPPVGQIIIKRLNFVADRLNEDYLLGADLCVADAYLLVMLIWARKINLSLHVPLPAYFERGRDRRCCPAERKRRTRRPPDAAQAKATN